MQRARPDAIWRSIPVENLHLAVARVQFRERQGSVGAGELRDALARRRLPGEPLHQVAPR